MEYVAPGAGPRPRLRPGRHAACRRGPSRSSLPYDSQGCMLGRRIRSSNTAHRGLLLIPFQPFLFVLKHRAVRVNTPALWDLSGAGVQSGRNGGNAGVAARAAGPHVLPGRAAVRDIPFVAHPGGAVPQQQRAYRCRKTQTPTSFAYAWIFGTAA